MAAGYSVLCFNAVLKAVVDACTANTINVNPANVLPLSGPIAGLQTPFILVALPKEPYEQDSWGGTSSLKNGLFKVNVGLATELREEDMKPAGTPFGSSSQLGLLVLSDQVQDALEAAYATLRAASPRVVDVLSTTTAFIKDAPEARQAWAVTQLIFKIRFFAGQRSAP